MADMVWTALLQIGKLAFVAAVAGVGPFALLVPSRWRHGWLVLPLLINCGLALVAIVAVHAIYNKHAVGSAVPVAILLSFGCLAVVSICKRRRLKSAWCTIWHDFLREGGWSALLLAAALLAAWPGIQTGGEQPYRVGVDEIGYAVTAQYLREGGTREALEQRIERETGQPTRTEALSATSTALSFNANIVSEFILKSQRSGYPGLIAAMLQAIGVDWVHSGQWLLLVFPIWLAVALTAVFLSEDLGLPRPASVLWALAVGLNCNLLNVLCEGQQAQIFTTAFAGVITVLWWRWRQGAKNGVSFGRMFGREFGLAAFSFAVIAATYSEHLMVLGGVGALMLLADAALDKGRINHGNWIIVLSCITGLVLMGRYSVEWVPFVFRHVRNVASGGSGFPQPQWALPIDILGYTNIYSVAVPNFIGRGWWIALPLGLASLALLEATFWAALTRRISDAPFWLAPMAFAAAIFAKSFYWDHFHNYNYMKAYTLLLLPLMALHALTVSEVARFAAEHWPSRRWIGSLQRAAVLLPAWIAVTGMIYLNDYERDARTMPRGVQLLSSKESRRLMCDSCVVIGGNGGIGNMMLGAYTDLFWLNLGWADPFLPPHEGKRILFLALKRDLLRSESISKRHAASIVLENEDLLLVDTGQRVQVPPQQIGRAGIEPLDRTNPAKPRWPMTMTPQWARIVDKMMN